MAKERRLVSALALAAGVPIGGGVASGRLGANKQYDAKPRSQLRDWLLNS